jgi:ribosome-binding protein aMBF1 (putative translation factor)
VFFPKNLYCSQDFLEVKCLFANGVFSHGIYHILKGLQYMLGKKIKELREIKGLSCSELARRTMHSVATIHGIETGRNKNPSFRVICDISDALNVSLKDLKNAMERTEQAHC